MTARIQFTLLTTLLLTANVADFRKYEPCELAQEIYALKAPQLEKILDILICVAAFHDFNSSSIRMTPDGVPHYGIFGLTSTSWYWQGRYGGRQVDWGDVRSDALKFSDESLQAGSSPDDIAQSYYRRLCSEPENQVYGIRCHLSDYVMGDYPLILPKNDLLYGRFQFPNETLIIYNQDWSPEVTEANNITTTVQPSSSEQTNTTENSNNVQRNGEGVNYAL